MEYVDVTSEDLHTLGDALVLLERLHQHENPLKLYLYGISQDPGVLDAAREAIAEESDERISEQDIQLGEVVVEIAISSDVLHYLLGSGVKLSQNDEFSYMGQQGEGIRTVGFNWANYKPAVTVGNLTKMALSADSGYSNDFLQKYGNKTPMNVTVQRDELSAIPAPPAAVPKQTSVPDAKKLHWLMEDFLGD